MRVTYRESARTDVIRQFRYYLVTCGLPEVASRFKSAVRSAVEEIRRQPAIGTPVQTRNPQLRSLRSWPIEGFESIRRYFLVGGDTIHVVRILHGKQNVRKILARQPGSLR